MMNYTWNKNVCHSLCHCVPSGTCFHSTVFIPAPKQTPFPSETKRVCSEGAPVDAAVAQMWKPDVWLCWCVPCLILLTGSSALWDPQDSSRRRGGAGVRCEGGMQLNNNMGHFTLGGGVICEMTCPRCAARWNSVENKPVKSCINNRNDHRETRRTK